MAHSLLLRQVSGGPQDHNDGIVFQLDGAEYRLSISKAPRIIHSSGTLVASGVDVEVN
jgi:hypothetical protein